VVSNEIVDRDTKIPADEGFNPWLIIDFEPERITTTDLEHGIVYSLFDRLILSPVSLVEFSTGLVMFRPIHDPIKP